MKRFLLLYLLTVFTIAALAQNAENKKSERRLAKIEKTATTNAIMKAEGEYEVITEKPDGETKTYSRKGHAYILSDDGTPLETEQDGKTIEIVFASDNETVYLKNPLSTYPYDAWVKATLNGNTITLPLGQAVRYSQHYNAYVVMAIVNKSAEGSFSLDTETKEITYTIDGDEIRLNDTSASRILSAYWTDDMSWSGYADWESVYTKFNMEGITPPEKLITKTYGMDTEGVNDYFSLPMTIGIDGTDIYIKGIYDKLPEAWIKGSFDGNMAVFPAKQYMGISENGAVYLTGSNNSTDMCDIELAYNTDDDTFSQLTKCIVFSEMQDEISAYDYYIGSYIFPYEDTAHTPATPIIKRYIAMTDDNFPELNFKLPFEDTEGNRLLRSKLYYQMYLVTNNEMSEVVLPGVRYNTPEDLSIINYYYMNMLGIGYDADDDAHYVVFPLDDSNWQAVGVQAIYYGTQEKRSPIAWYEIVAGTGIDEYNAKDNQKTVYYDLKGNTVNNPTHGVYIEKTKENGKIKTRKIII